MKQYREYYHRHLPHWQPRGATFFVTFRLKDSLPREVIESLREENELKKQTLEKISEAEHAKQDDLDERRFFVRWDSLLDRADFGPRWLSQPEIAGTVKEALHYRDGREYDLYAFCIMSNHVHAVFEPLNLSLLSLNKIMQSLKRHTARRANTVLGRVGAFWQDESYDHVIRDNEEFLRIIHYALENPVKAGLVSRREDWPWTYCKDGLL
jgi:REP element-mobilizing transposase RayT